MPQEPYDISSSLAENTVKSKYVETVCGMEGPSVQLRIGDLPGLTATLDGYQKRIANQGTEIASLKERVDHLLSALFLAFLMIFALLGIVMVEANALGWFR